jgi:hypothetical protein
VNNTIKFLVIVSLVALLSTGCSSNNNGNGDSLKPQPQVRVGARPSSTPEPTVQVDNLALTAAPSPSAAPAQLYYDPTPDEDAIANQIQSMMDEIDRKLKSNIFLLK